MKQFEITFIDMDNVLCDFVKSAVEISGRKYDPEDIVNWNIWELWGCSQQEFWLPIIEAGSSFWSEIEPYSWFGELINLAKSVGDEVKIITHSQQWPECYYGKVQWYVEHASEFELITCKSKHLMVAPNRLLIDDSDSNVEAWRKAGGKAVLFPQRWNKAADKRHSKIAAVKEAISNLAV